MNKFLKRTLITLVAAALVIGGVFAGLTVYKNVNRKPVSVYRVEEVGMIDSIGNTSQTDATVSADGIQKVYPSDTQTVTSVEVKEGQDVKKGDVLIKYDTTLTSLDVQRAEIEFQKKQVDLRTAQSELKKIKTLVPHSTRTVIPKNNVTYTPVETPKLLQGSGIEDDPYIYLFAEGDAFDAQMIEEMLPADVTEEASEADVSDITKNTVYTAVITRENNALNAPIISRYGVILEIEDSAVCGVGFFEPILPENIEKYDEIPEPYEVDSGSEYTAAEIAKMRSDKEKEIADLEHSVKVAKNEYERVKLEAGDGIVRAEIDGKVTKIRTSEEAAENAAALIEVSAGGSYYIIGTMSEFERGTVNIGQTVDVEAYSWYDGSEQYYVGEIVEISDEPTENGYSYSDGDSNTNVSYYPFKVAVGAEAELTDDGYVMISYQTAEDSGNALFLPNMFIRNDAGGSYVFVRGEDQLLEKRYVTLGRDMWGEYTQIRRGLTVDDLIALPYGKNTAEKSETEEHPVEDFYGMMEW